MAARIRNIKRQRHLQTALFSIGSRQVLDNYVPPPYPPPLPIQMVYYETLENDNGPKSQLKFLDTLIPKVKATLINARKWLLNSVAHAKATIRDLNIDARFKELLIISEMIINEWQRKLPEILNDILRVPYKSFRAVGIIALMAALISFLSASPGLGSLALIAAAVQFGASSVLRTRLY